MASRIIQQYLATPPYLGRSTFADKAFVKATCGATCCWDGAKKLWGTRQIDCLITLVRSRKFQPFGIEPGWYEDLIDAAYAFASEAEAKWREQNAVPKPQKPSVPKPAPNPAPRPAKKLAAKPEPIRKLAPSNPPAAAPSSAHAQPAAASTSGGLPAPRPEEVAECARLGFTADGIAYSNNLDYLGPRGTLSNEGRVLRWCLVLSSDARYEAWAIKGDDYFAPEVWMPLADRKQRAYAAQLDEECHAHAQA